MFGFQSGGSNQGSTPAMSEAFGILAIVSDPKAYKKYLEEIDARIKDHKESLEKYQETVLNTQRFKRETEKIHEEALALQKANVDQSAILLAQRDELLQKIKEHQAQVNIFQSQVTEANKAIAEKEKNLVEREKALVKQHGVVSGLHQEAKTIMDKGKALEIEYSAKLAKIKELI